MVDTGSAITLISYSSAKARNLHIDTKHVKPILRGVTGRHLHVIGVVSVVLRIGDTNVSRCIPVVPTNYLRYDVLLGVDVTGKGELVWDNPKGIIKWRGSTIPCTYDRKLRKFDWCRKIRVIKPIVRNPSTLIKLEKPVHLKGYSTSVIRARTCHPVGSVLIVEPLFGNFPILATVDHAQEIPFPITNNSKSPKTWFKGTVMGFCEQPIEEMVITQIQPEIINELVPKDHGFTNLSRKDRLKEIMKSERWHHLSAVQHRDLQSLLLDHESLFILQPGELGRITGEDVHIEIANKRPAKTRSFRYPEKAKEIIANLLLDMKEKDIIEPSTSAWLSPIVLVAKPDGSKRMCLDYREVNKHLAEDIHPLPRLEELVEVAAGHKYYATLDMREAYFQLVLDQDSRDLTTFSDGVSLFRFKRLPFGLNCSPAIFSRKMAEIIAPLVAENWIRNYLDDIIVWADSYDSLLARLDKLFGVLKDRGVKLNLKKCDIGHSKVKFLGHIVSRDGSSPDPDNIKAVQDRRPPKTVKQVRSFLGLCGFYRRFVKNFTKIALPLTALTRKTTKFVWTEKCQRAFEELKRRLTMSPILINPDLNAPFTLTTDASDAAIGAVLSQFRNGTQRVVGYFSRKLSGAESRYSVTDREALAVVRACRHFYHFLWAHKFHINTDHLPLTSVFSRRTKSPRMSRWALEMRDYNFTISYVKGKDNVVADELSRQVNEVYAKLPVESFLGLPKDEFRLEQSRDHKCIDLMQSGLLIKPWRKKGRIPVHKFATINGILYFSRRRLDGGIAWVLVIPDSLKQKALTWAHEAVGHLGQRKTLAECENLFYWDNLRGDTFEFVQTCWTCQKIKQSQGLMQKWQDMPRVERPLDRVSLDLIDLVGGANSFRYALTIVDHYSRFVRAYPLQDKGTQKVIKMFKRYIQAYGPPSTVLTDNGMEFASGAFKQLCDKENITHAYSTPYHPQGNSLIERLHGTLKGVLAALCIDNPKAWPTAISTCEMILNSAVHGTTGVQPFFAFHGRYAPRRVGSTLPTVDGGAEGRDLARDAIRKTNKERAAKYLKAKNMARRNESVPPGALVWVRREESMPGISRKLCTKWAGPYKVDKSIREGSAYVLKDLRQPNTVIQRAAEKVKRCHTRDEYLLDSDTDPGSPEHESPPVRRRSSREKKPLDRLVVGT